MLFALIIEHKRMTKSTGRIYKKMQIIQIYYRFVEAANEPGGNKEEKEMSDKEYRRELQIIIACNIYNRI